VPVVVTELHVVEVVAVLRELTARIISSDGLDEALTRLVQTTANVVPGEAWCAITLVRAGEPTAAAVSADLPAGLAAGLDELAPPGADGPRRADGPALTAIRTREIVICSDLAAESRWPRWRARAAGTDIRSVLCVPLDVNDHAVGALTLYAREPASFSPDVQLTAILIAEHACLLLAAVLDRGRLAGVAAELTDALAGGETVNQAIGVVMAQRSCGADAALAVLSTAAETLKLPLREVADRLVRTVDPRGAGISTAGCADPTIMGCRRD
jgi:GAF domain-containing protein